MKLKRIIFSILITSLWLLFALHVAVLPSLAGDWRVSPLKVELSEKNKTGIFRVHNDGDHDLIVEMKVSEWIQDNNGQDQYIDTSDLIFFPKVMTVKGKEKRIIRVGTKLKNPETEKTYRLFIREVNPQKKQKAMGVAIAVQFAVPIFLSARAPHPKLELVSASYRKGILSFTLTNNGNTHVTLRSITIDGTSRAGTPLFNGQLRGWYLLAGASRTYTYELPHGACQETGRITIKAAGEGIEAVKDILLEDSVCEEQQ